MKITTTARCLRSALEISESVQTARNDQNSYIETTAVRLIIEPVASMLIIDAYGQEAELGLSVPVTVSECGGESVAVVKLNTLKKSLAQFDNELAALSIGGKTVTVECGSSLTIVSTLAAETFREEQMKVNPVYSAIVKENILKKALQFTAPIADTNVAAVQFGSVKLAFENDRLTAIASDRYKLVQYRAKGSVETPLKFSSLLPKKSAYALAKALNVYSTSFVDVACDNERISVVSDRFSFRSSLFAANYPAIDKIANAERGNIFEVDSAEMLAAIERLTGVAEEKAAIVEMNADGEAIEMKSTNPQIGTVTKERVFCRRAVNSNLCIKVNAALLGQILKTLRCGRVKILAHDSKTPIAINPADKEIDDEDVNGFLNLTN